MNNTVALEGKGLKVLVADDSQSIRMLMESFLREMGHHPVSVSDGQQACNEFQLNDYDIVLLDLVMPNMDGFEATRLIKSYSELKTSWTPILIISSADDVNNIVKGLNCGAEDFIPKPLHRDVLRAKIGAYARSIYAYHKLLESEKYARTTAEELVRLHGTIKDDLEIANEVMDKLILKQALSDPKISYKLIPTSQFSGDLLAVIRSRTDKLYVMVADATGHGLAAAISVLPALWIFYGMAAKDFTISEIVAEMNKRLRETVPLGRFVAAHLACINYPAKVARLWSGGMPPAFSLNKETETVTHYRSKNLPLGILPVEAFNPNCELIEWTEDEELILFSDGLVDATSPSGVMFGEAKIEALLCQKSLVSTVECLSKAVLEHLQCDTAHDDVSFMSIALT